MNFLFPLYMLGALAIAIPILLHLRRRPPRDRVVFSSLMFLDPNTPQRKRRSKLENLLLLALRCLALLLLALLFSRPFFRNPDALAEVTSGTVRIILLDRSASLQRDGLWEDARKKVEAVVAKSDSRDRISLLTFDSQVEVLLGFNEWSQMLAGERKAAAVAALKEVKPSWSSTSLDLALTEAVGLVEDETQDVVTEKEIVLVSDFQEGSELTLLENFAWPEDIDLRLISLEPKKLENAAAHLVAQIETEEGEDNPEILEQAQAKRIRVTNGVSSKVESFKLRWAGDNEDHALDVLLPPGATRVVSAPPRPEGESDYLELTGDSDAFDNRVYVAPTQARPVEVLYLGDTVNPSDTSAPLFYLRRAFSPTESLAPEVKAKLISDFTQQDVLRADVLVVASDPSEDPASSIEQFVQQGGVAIVPLSQKSTLAWLPGLGVEVNEARVDDYALLEGLDFEHPILRSFAGAALRDFSKIHFWKYRELTLPEPEEAAVEGEEDKAPATRFRMLAKYDSGDPAWVEAKLGKGRVYIFASSWVPRESQLALSSKYVPLIYSILQVAGFESDGRRQFYVGDSLPVPTGDATVILPDGSKSQGDTVAEEPGIYRIKVGAETFSYAVNVPVAESRLEPMSDDILTTLGITLAQENSTAKAEISEEDRVRMENADLEAQQKAWKWFLVLAIVILLGETWLANRREPLFAQEAKA